MEMCFQSQNVTSQEPSKAFSQALPSFLAVVWPSRPQSEPSRIVPEHDSRPKPCQGRRVASFQRFLNVMQIKLTTAEIL